MLNDGWGEWLPGGIDDGELIGRVNQGLQIALCSIDIQHRCIFEAGSSKLSRNNMKLANDMCECSTTPRVWDPPGRGTAAGDALFRLYNGFAATTQKGNQFSQDNRLDMLRRLSMAANAETPSSVTHRKPRVRMPRYRRRINPEDFQSYPVYGGRRKACLILEKMKDDFANIHLPPPPAKPVLDDKEKQRLQMIFEWSGLDEGPEDLAPKVAPVPRVSRGSREEKEHLLDSIAKEIEDREAFLQDMRKLGKEDIYKSQILWEIQDRVNQMKQLDKLMCAEDAKLAEKVLLRQDEQQSRKSIQWK